MRSFSEVRQSSVLGSKTYVALEKNESPCRLLIVANPPAVFQDADGVQHPFDQTGLEEKFTGSSLSYAVANLITSPPLGAPQPTVPYTPGMYLPMSAWLQLNSIDKNTVINSTGTPGGSELPLNRIVARVSVDATATGSNFILLGATVTGAPRSGALVQLGAAIKDNSGNLTDYISPAGDGVTGIAVAIGNTTAANPIYLYESAEASTSVIIRGSFKGTEGYYRLAFRIGDERIDVMRNHTYHFAISSVTGVGHSTLAGALTSPPSSNITFSLLDSDESTGIVENGQYYLGATNSEFVVYEDALDMFNVPAVTISTDAPTTVTTRTIEVNGPGLSLTNPGLQISVTGDVATTDIYINMSAGFTQGTITVHVGDLSKTIAVRRAPRLSFLPTAILFPADYVAGEVTSRSPWIGFSLVPDPSAAAAEVRNNYSGDIYMIPSYNYSSFPRSASAYLSRSGDQGGVRIYAVQGDGQVTPSTITNGYVGTFHRNDQTGERIIRMSNPATGVWSATVAVGADFITLDTKVRAGFPYNDSNAENYPVTGGSFSVSGTGVDILFRVGLKSKLPEGARPRYGLIVVSYGGTGAAAKYHFIYVRQGEQPDYLLGTSVRWSPYNLSDPLHGTGGTNITNHNVFTPRAAVTPATFVGYPTQAGYLFQWNGDGGTASPAIRAYHPRSPGGGIALTGWPSANGSAPWDPAKDVCPVGYRTPTEGEFLLGFFGTANSAMGYYADGFFDRREIGESVYNNSPNSTVNGTNNYEVAYRGRVYFNNANNTNYASIFVPAGGYRSEEFGTITSAGVVNNPILSTATRVNNSYIRIANGTGIQDATARIAPAVRCIAE